MNNSACIEDLRGAQLSKRSQWKPGGLLGVINKTCSLYKSGKGGDNRDRNMLQDLNSKFGMHIFFVASPSVGGAADRYLFGINHSAGPALYDVSSFIENDTDLLDLVFISLL